LIALVEERGEGKIDQRDEERPDEEGFQSSAWFPMTVGG